MIICREYDDDEVGMSVRIEDDSIDMNETFAVNEHGNVADPGKWQCIPPYAVWFWLGITSSMFMVHDEPLHKMGYTVSVLEVENWVKARFPEIPTAYNYIALWELDQGFVVMKGFENEGEYEEWREEHCIDQPEEEGDDNTD